METQDKDCLLRQEALEDAQDLAALEEAKQADADEPTISLAEVKRLLNIPDPPLKERTE